MLGKAYKNLRGYQTFSETLLQAQESSQQTNSTLETWYSEQDYLPTRCLIYFLSRGPKSRRIRTKIIQVRKEDYRSYAFICDPNSCKLKICILWTLTEHLIDNIYGKTVPFAPKKATFAYSFLPICNH
jgi:hypothetical protein